jgi:hypothetical protein
LHRQGAFGKIALIMTLFLIFSAPLFFLFIVLLPWDADVDARKLSLLSVFLKGLFCFFPAYVICVIVDAVVGSPLTGFALYLSMLIKNHLAPLLLGVGSFILVQRKLEFPSTQEGIFLTIFSFISGYYALFGAVDFLALFGQWDAAILFLIPVLRLASILTVSLGAVYFYRWEGSSAAAFLGSSAALCVVLSTMIWLYNVNFRGLSVILSLAAFCVSAAYFVMRFPRALRIGSPSVKKS